MYKHLKFLAILLALVASAAFSTSGVHAQTTSCDTGGSVSGTATPAYGTVGTTIIFRATGFQGGEDVSFWFTLPDGSVLGTAAPVPGGVNSDGSIGPLPLPIDQSFVNVATGRWAITFQGASSNHQAVIYFCVLTTAEATAIAQPTTVPTAAPTNTGVPATATTAATVGLPTSTSEVPTAEASATSVAQPTSTTAVPPTVEVRSPTPEVAPPTAVAPAATATTEVLPLPTAVAPGMPRTGQGGSGDPTSAISLLLAAALGALSLGWIVRRKSTCSR